MTWLNRFLVARARIPRPPLVLDSLWILRTMARTMGTDPDEYALECLENVGSVPNCKAPFNSPNLALLRGDDKHPLETFALCCALVAAKERQS